MALNFPNIPLDGDTWTDPSNGALYEYTLSSKSWSVIGLGLGGGTVTLINVVGANGAQASGGPVSDNGTFTVEIDIDNSPILP